jgi:hypothetical protein
VSQRGTGHGQPSGHDEPGSGVRGRWVPAAAGAAGIAGLLFAYQTLPWRSLAAFAGVVRSCPELFCDFTLYYYPMGEAVFRTGLPVDGFLYSPFIAILLAAFPSLGVGVSRVVWGIAQGLSVFLYLLLFQRLVPSRLRTQLLFVVLALSSFPLLFNELAGQVSVFIIVAVLGALVFAGRGHRAAAAALLALAVSFKFYPILFFAPFALRRDVRFVLFAVAACGTALVVVPGVLLGFGDTMRFYGTLLQSFRDSNWIAANPHSQFFPHLVLRAVDTTVRDAQPYVSLLHGIAYGVAIANMGLVFLVQRARLRDADLWSFQLVFLTIPFVLKTSWPHDFVFLSFTQALLARQLLEGGRAARPCQYRAFTSVLLVLSMVISNIVFFVLLGDFVGYGLLGFLFWANLFLLIGLYLQLLPPALRSQRQVAV